MPASGFTRLPASTVPEAHTGRIWRVNLQDGTAASQGNKSVESIVVDESGVVVRFENGQTRYGFEEIESVLVEDALPVQRTIIAWGGT